MYRPLPDPFTTPSQKQWRTDPKVPHPPVGFQWQIQDFPGTQSPEAHAKAVADPGFSKWGIGGSRGGVRDARPPLGVQILSISCSFRENLACSRPPWRVHAPPRENPGSTTVGGAVLSQMGGRTSCFQVKSA